MITLSIIGILILVYGNIKLYKCWNTPMLDLHTFTYLIMAICAIIDAVIALGITIGLINAILKYLP